MTGYRATVSIAPMNSSRRLFQTRLCPASMSQKPVKTTASTPKMTRAFRNWRQPRLKYLNVFIDTMPAHRNTTNSSTPFPEKISSGSSETMYTGRTTRLGKKACRYRMTMANGIRNTIDGANHSTRNEATAVRVKTVSR